LHYRTHTVVYLNPTVTGTTTATRCGTGTVNLAATGSAGSTLNWYANQTGGSSLYTGSAFTTPVISTSTSYWVEAGFNGSSVSVGALSPTAQGGTIGAQITDWDVNFTTFASTTLQSVDIYPVTAGQAGVITVRSGSGTRKAEWPPASSQPLSGRAQSLRQSPPGSECW